MGFLCLINLSENMPEVEGGYCPFSLNKLSNLQDKNKTKYLCKYI